MKTSQQGSPDPAGSLRATLSRNMLASAGKALDHFQSGSNILVKAGKSTHAFSHDGTSKLRSSVPLNASCWGGRGQNQSLLPLHDPATWDNLISPLQDQHFHLSHNQQAHTSGPQ